MPKIALPPIRLKRSLVASAKKENVITKSELTWLCDELRKQGSTITHRVLVDLFHLEHTCPQRYEKEVELITDYILAKRTLVRKLKLKLETLKK